MLVNHAADHVTHAVIGAKTVHQMTFDDTGHLADILSKALYSDKPRAVVREVLCNAWDIHIETGRTDTPVEVTVTADELIIRDFGTGIHDDDMGQRYGTYGGSTKEKDSRVTGGFGLGCKAPFALADHFQVTSFHEGRKTIYAVSKSSAEVKGKPGISPIVSVPTTETGLEVKVDISSSSKALISKLVFEIAAFGEMNVILNGTKLRNYPYSEGPNGYLILDNRETHSQHFHRINVRYGNVVYPVTIHDDFRKEHSRVTNFIIDYLGTDAGIIIKAPANGIGVTPSRETLSYTEVTNATLKAILAGFVTGTQAKVDAEILKAIPYNIENNWRNFQQWKLLDSLKTLKFQDQDLKQHMTAPVDIARLSVTKKYPNRNGFDRRDLSERLRSLIEGGVGNPGKTQSFGNYIRRNDTSRNLSDWFQRKIVGPLITRMIGRPELRAANLMVYGRPRNHRGYYTKHYPDFTEARSWPRCVHLEYVPFLRNIIVLAHSRKAIVDRVDDYPGWRFFGNREGFLAYIVPKTSKEIDKIRSFFTDQRFLVIDLTKQNSWDKQDYFAKKVPAPKPEVQYIPTPRPKGLPLLSSAITTSGSDGRVFMSMAPFKLPSCPRIDAPEATIHLSSSWDSGTFSSIDNRTKEAIAFLFGNRIGVTLTPAQREKHKDLPSFFPWLIEQVINLLEQNADLHQSLLMMLVDRRAFRTLDVPNYQVCMIALSDPVISKALGVQIKTLVQTKELSTIIDCVHNNGHKFPQAQREKLNALIAKITIPPHIEDFLKRFAANRFVSLISASKAQKIFDNSSVTAETLAKTRKIILSVLKD